MPFNDLDIGLTAMTVILGLLHTWTTIRKLTSVSFLSVLSFFPLSSLLSFLSSVFLSAARKCSGEKGQEIVDIIVNAACLSRETKCVQCVYFSSGLQNKNSKINNKAFQSNVNHSLADRWLVYIQCNE